MWQELTKLQQGNHRRAVCLLACVAVCLCWMLAGCQERQFPAAQTTKITATTDPSASHFDFRSALTGDGLGWVILLPGSSGLTIFDDDQHYSRAAERLRGAGFNVLIVDYKRAWRAALDRPDGIAGDRIAWVTGRAIQWMKQQHPITRRQPGAVIGWSLGGEGVFSLLNNSPRSRELGIVAAATYYPSNQENRTLHTSIPLLILSGESDNVTPFETVRALTNPNGPTHLISFPEAGHGFDIVTLSTPRTMRMPPIIGQKYTFAYNAQAAGGSAAALDEFLAMHLHPPD